MKFYIIFVFMLYWSSANSTFWFKDDFERVVDTYRNALSKDYLPYLRALSIFKRKLQLLGFYPIVSTDDGLDYVSLDAYIIEDDYDDRMYELLKKMKKEKKSRRKLSKKEMKKSKKKISSTTTAAKSISNIVYYWPSTIMSNSYENGNGYQQSSIDASASSTNFQKKPYYEESDESEEDNSGEEDNSAEMGDNKLIATHKIDQNNRVNEFDKTVKTENENGLDTQRKLEVVDDVEGNNSKSLDQSDQSVYHTNVLTKQESGKGKTNQTSTTTPSTTTQYPLLTVFPDPDEVVIQEILDQQELINKISVEEQGNLTVNGAVPTTKDVLTEVEDDIELNTTSNFINSVEDNLTQFDDELHQEMIQTQTGNLDEEYFSEITKTLSESETDLQHHLEEGWSLLDSINSQLNESEYQSTGSIVEKDKNLEPITDTLEIVVESTTSIQSGVVDFFPDTLPKHDEHFSASISSNHSKIPDNASVSDYNPKHPDISSGIPETTETTETTGGYLEIVSEHNDTTPQVNEPTTLSHSITQSLDEDLTPGNYPQHPHITDKTSETTIPQASDIRSELNLSPQSASNTEQSETMPYQTTIEYLDSDIDPKILNDTFESRGLTDMPMLTVTFDDKNGRSDVAIEPDDFFDDDITDNLPYNLSSDNVLEQSNVIENVSAETSTELPTKDAINLGNVDQIDAEIIPLIPIILKQMKKGNVSPEEMEILKATFGQFWPIILEEANRDSNSSEEMNPVLSKILSPVHRRVVKREATFGRLRRPIIGRRVYYDDDVEYVYPRRYLGRRRRPVIEYYYK